MRTASSPSACTDVLGLGLRQGRPFAVAGLLLAALAAPHAGAFPPDATEASKQACNVDYVYIAVPRDGTTLVTGLTSDALPLPVNAVTNCPESTQRVNFVVDDVEVDSVTDRPYNLRSIPLGGLLVSHALKVAIEQVGTAGELYEDTSDFYLERASTSDDSDDNGYPDFPYNALAGLGNGSMWITEVPVPGAGSDRIVSVTRWAGIGATARGDVPVTTVLESPDHPGATVTVQMPQALIVPGETAMLLVALADDLDVLVGLDEADLMGDEPERGLISGGQYVEISVITSVDGGITFDEISDTRLAANPIHLIMEGLTMWLGDNPTFFGHPTLVDSDPVDGVRVLVQNGAEWSRESVLNVVATDHMLEADLTALSVYAPYRSEGGEGEGEGEGEGDLGVPLVVAILAAIAGIPIAVGLGGGGGGGGSGPCFIATAAFGTPMVEAIDTLRLFRDVFMLDNAAGTAFVDLYYRVSPPVADMVARSPVLAAAVRFALWPVIVAARLTLASPAVSALLAATASLALSRRRRRNSD